LYEDAGFSSESDSDFDSEHDFEEDKDEEQPVSNDLASFKWSFQNKVGKAKKEEEMFQALQGPANCQLNAESDPFEFFSLIFSEGLITNIMNWTNKKARSKIDNASRRKQKKLLWEDITLVEMHSFIGCILTMGIMKLPSIKMYWSTQSKLFSIAGIREIMTQQRFYDIYSCLCTQNPECNSSINKKSKIEPLMITVISNSQFYYRPGQNLSIDESMIPFRGRSSLKVFMPLKPTRYGLKAYLLCEATTGYVLSWTLHTGEILPNESQKVTERLIIRLTDGFEGEGFNLYMDRYYTGIKILLDLKDININACGTIRKDRLKLSKENKNKISQIQDREIMFFKGSSGLLLTVWEDSKTVLLASNFHQPDKIKVERRISKKDIQEGSEPGMKEEVIIPKSIYDYNIFMRGVDRFDQLSSNYYPDLRSKRWYVKVFFHFLEVGIINSYVLYKQVIEKENKKPMTHLEYRQCIIRELVKDARELDNIPQTPKKKVIKKQNSSSPKDISKDQGKIKVSLSTVKKSLNFEDSKEKNDINLSTIKKKKAENSLKDNPDCRLAEIPSDPTKRTTVRKRCQLCNNQNKDNNEKTTITKGTPQTRYWCEIHKVPVCILVCYDRHRNMYTLNIDKNLKKTKTM